MNKYKQFLIIFFVFCTLCASSLFSKQKKSELRHSIGMNIGSFYPIALESKTRLHERNFPSYTHLNIYYDLKYHKSNWVPHFGIYNIFDFHLSSVRKNYNLSLFFGVSWKFPAFRGIISLGASVGPRLKVVNVYSLSSFRDNQESDLVFSSIGINIGTFFTIQYQYSLFEKLNLTVGLPIFWHPEVDSSLLGTGFNVGLEFLL